MSFKKIESFIENTQNKKNKKQNIIFIVWSTIFYKIFGKNW